MIRFFIHAVSAPLEITMTLRNRVGIIAIRIIVISYLGYFITLGISIY